MELPVVIAVTIVAALGGAVLGVVLRGVWASQSMKAAHSEARRIEAEARARQKELILEAKDEKLRMQREAEDEARSRRTELSSLEHRLLQRDEQLDQRTDMLEQRDRKLLDRERELERAREEVAKAHQEQIAALEHVSQVSAEDAKSLLLEAVREEAEHDAVKLARAIERKAREEADEKARDIVEMLPRFFDLHVSGGILHFANAGECSWQEYAQFALDCCRSLGISLKAKTVGASKLADMKNWMARRPVYSVLSSEKFFSLTGATPRNWRDAVADYVRGERN